MHLGLYRNDFLPDRLPFGVDIAMRNQFNFTMNNRIGYENISVIDPFHPIMDDVDSSAFAAVHEELMLLIGYWYISGNCKSNAVGLLLPFIYI